MGTEGEERNMGTGGRRECMGTGRGESAWVQGAGESTLKPERQALGSASGPEKELG